MPSNFLRMIDFCLIYCIALGGLLVLLGCGVHAQTTCCESDCILKTSADLSLITDNNCAHALGSIDIFQSDLTQLDGTKAI